MTAEEILDKFYPKERTIFREVILKAMEEYAKSKQAEVWEEGFNAAESEARVELVRPKNPYK